MNSGKLALLPGAPPSGQAVAEGLETDCSGPLPSAAPAACSRRAVAEGSENGIQATVVTIRDQASAPGGVVPEGEGEEEEGVAIDAPVGHNGLSKGDEELYGRVRPRINVEVRPRGSLLLRFLFHSQIWQIILTSPSLPVLTLQFAQVGLTLPSGQKVLAGVTGLFPHSQMHAILGPSGSGKTTFLSVLMGRATYGEQSGAVKLLLDPRDVPEGTKTACTINDLKNITGMVPQVLSHCPLGSSYPR